MKVEKRFLTYVSFPTMSKEGVETIPSTKEQFALGTHLKNELESLPFSKVKLDENGYVYALLPATKGMEKKTSIGFISHMDTAPAFSGTAINPQIINDYNGFDVILPKSGATLFVKDFPDLKTLKGNTLITTDGTTLLGADDKAGIAEIITAMETLITNNIPHGDIWVGFTPDEEVGRGADLFDLSYFKAKYAYTLDGDYEGEIAYENFNAASARFSIQGKSVHPGSAKNIMINAAAIGCELQTLLPAFETPEHTEGYEGFFMLEEFKGDISSATLSYIIRDHDANKFLKKKNLCKDIVSFLNQKYGKDTITLEIKDSYRNMAEVIEQHKEIISLAKQAIIDTGLDLVSTPVRGGTDGARLSFMGLPCPNLGTGGHGYHGPFEHIAVESMESAVQVIINICKSVK